MQKTGLTVHRQRGVTLIELMVTVAVAAILLGVGVPAMRDMILDNRRAAVVNELIASLHLARSTAYVDAPNADPNIAIVVCPGSGNTCSPGTDWNNGWIVFRDVNGNTDVDADDRIIDRGEATPEGITLQSTATVLRYRRNRGMFGGTLSACIDGADATRGRDIVVGLTGYPRLRNPSTNCP